MDILLDRLKTNEPKVHEWVISTFTGVLFEKVVLSRDAKNPDLVGYGSSSAFESFSISLKNSTKVNHDVLTVLVSYRMERSILLQYLTVGVLSNDEFNTRYVRLEAQAYHILTALYSLYNKGGEES